RPAAGVARAVLLLGDRGAGDQVVAVIAALVGGRLEPVVGIEPLGPFRVLVVARPLDARALGELGVAQAAVVADRPSGADLPCLERPFGVGPLDQGLAVLVAEV